MNKNTSVPPRELVDPKETWDLTPLCKDNEDFQKRLADSKKQVQHFCEMYQNKKLNLSQIGQLLKDYDKLLEDLLPLIHYGFLISTTDLTNAENKQITFQSDNFSSEFSAQTKFVEDDLLALTNEEIKQLQKDLPQFTGYLRKIKKYKKITLSPEVEHVLTKLEPTFNSYSNIYGQIRSADLHFSQFSANGQTYPLSFSLYEDRYSYDPDPKIRRNAFAKFSEELSHHQNAAAANYLAQVSNEKRLADLHGFDSVIDYLLFDQEVDRSLFNRQIDLIIEKFGPIMQKYLKFVAQERGLDKMTFADRLIDLDPKYAPKVSIADSKKFIKDAIAILGDDYQKMIMPAFEERWVDFAQNQGKETGGFCLQPYETHPYILLTWQDGLADVYTLIHELGHAGQGILCTQNHPVLETEPSTYLIEAPSTFNELLLTYSLENKATDPRQKRFALSKMLTNTYFHNFITHLLEAAYQREVYRLIDAGKSFNADKLNEITKQVYSEFFGDALELNPGSELTWMRQSHYYMGLYSYTYSASLTIATQAFLNIKKFGQPAIEKWLDFLKLGNSKDPVAAAATAGVDINSDQPLLNTINYLDQTVNQIIALTKEIK